jgi:hypothetical protein
VADAHDVGVAGLDRPHGGPHPAALLEREAAGDVDLERAEELVAAIAAELTHAAC